MTWEDTVTDSTPSKEQLAKALAAAGRAHHDYESNYLAGKRDEQWPGWYAAFVLGRLGDFTTPTTLSHWLEEAPGDTDWATSTGAFVAARL